MAQKLLLQIAIAVLVTPGPLRACCEAKKDTIQCKKKSTKTEAVEQILGKLRKATERLKSYKADVEYLFRQPIFESQTLRKGILYYAKPGDKILLRLNFNTLKQDEQKAQKYIEQYIFDGMWLTHIDYQIQSVKRYQLVDPNELKDANQPVDDFDLLARRFPMVGFSETKNLEKEFEITLITPPTEQSKGPVHLHLVVKPGSIYKDDYTSIDIWIDKKTYLPVKITAVSTEEDIYELNFLKAKVNQRINKKVFDWKIPPGFTVEEVPLKKATPASEAGQG